MKIKHTNIYMEVGKKKYELVRVRGETCKECSLYIEGSCPFVYDKVSCGNGETIWKEVK